MVKTDYGAYIKAYKHILILLNVFHSKRHYLLIGDNIIFFLVDISAEIFKKYTKNVKVQIKKLIFKIYFS